MKRLIPFALLGILIVSFSACAGETPCRHSEINPSAYFDQESHFPSKGVCNLCSEEVEFDSIQIWDEEDLMQLGNDIKDNYDIGCYSISINDDIDMAAKVWMSPYLDGSKSAFNKKSLVIDGNGHTISNLSAGSETETTHQGFIGHTYSSVELVIRNLTLSDASFTNKDDGEYSSVGGFVGNIEATTSVTLENCHLRTSHLDGGHYAGGLYGYGAAYSKEDDGPVATKITIKNCSVEKSTIESEGSTGGIAGHADGDKDTTVVVSDCRVEDNHIYCTKANVTDKAGSLFGTVHVGKVTVSNAAISGNDVKSDGVPNGNVYGRHLPGETGKFILEGEEVKPATEVIQ